MLYEAGEWLPAVFVLFAVSRRSFFRNTKLKCVTLITYTVIISRCQYLRDIGSGSPGPAAIVKYHVTIYPDPMSHGPTTCPAEKTTYQRPCGPCDRPTFFAELHLRYPFTAVSSLNPSISIRPSLLARNLTETSLPQRPARW